MDSVTPGKGDEMTLKTTGTFVSHCFANYSCPPADGVPRRSGSEKSIQHWQWMKRERVFGSSARVVTL
jgi:hypothetical protein